MIADKVTKEYRRDLAIFKKSSKKYERQRRVWLKAERKWRKSLWKYG